MKVYVNMVKYFKENMKKSRLLDIINVLFHLRQTPRKKGPLYYGMILMKIRDIIRKGRLSFHNFPPNEKNVISYINSRNMRKTLTPFSLSERNGSLQNEKIHGFNKKEINSLSLNLEHLKKTIFFTAFPNFLKFHTISDLQGKMVSNKSKGDQQESPESWGGTEAFKLILHITNNYSEVIKKYNSVLVFFHANWCPHCSRLKRPYGTAALMAKEAKLDTLFAAFDVAVDPDLAVEKGVVGIPLILYYKNAKLVTNYRGKRTADDLFQFVKDPPETPSSVDAKKQDI